MQASLRAKTLYLPTIIQVLPLFHDETLVSGSSAVGPLVMRDVGSGFALTRIVDLFDWRYPILPTGLATLHEFARYSSHKADDDFPALLWDSKARIRVIYEFRQWYKLDSGAVVKESCYAMKGVSPQIRREGDDANVIF